MKFSILLPTRDRLDLLKLAIESVRLQDYADWEIIVSDNASDESACSFVDSLRDARIRCFRTDRLLPVTENWNAALERASGDYVIMLGDDDGLMRRCLSRARALIEEWRHPEAIYTEACQYAYPGVIAGHAEGFVQFGYNAFLQGKERAFRLPRETALDMVRASTSFRLRYSYNMQHFIVSRRLVERLGSKGAFFQSPYPDYYAANAILLAADSVIANPEPLVMIGISPKSFGFYYFNNREADGVAFLQNIADEDIRQHLRGVIVPGSNMNDSWLFAMETLARNFRDEVSLQVDYARYRMLQFHTCLRSRSRDGIVSVLRHATTGELLRYGALTARYVAACLLPPTRRRAVRDEVREAVSSFVPFDLRQKTVPYKNLLEAVSHYDG